MKNITWSSKTISCLNKLRKCGLRFSKVFFKGKNKVIVTLLMELPRQTTDNLLQSIEITYKNFGCEIKGLTILEVSRITCVEKSWSVSYEVKCLQCKDITIGDQSIVVPRALNCICSDCAEERNQVYRSKYEDWADIKRDDEEEWNGYNHY